MPNYLYNTVFTNYALRKLTNDLANPSYAYSPYNLIVVKIGDGDNTIDLDRKNLSRTICALNITDVKVTNTYITFTCEIPEEVEGISITEIGLFDIIDGQEKLFTYTKVDAVKPSDLGYKLVVELNLTLRTINFYPNLIKFVVTDYETATVGMLDELENLFLYIETNLERIIDFNSTEVGRNLPQVYYAKEKELAEYFLGASNSVSYFTALNRFGSSLRDFFCIRYEDILSYNIQDLAHEGPYINVYSNMLRSSGGSIGFSGPCTLSFTAYLGDFNESIPILNKVNPEDYTDIYFNIMIDNKTDVVFTLYGGGVSYSFRYELTSYELFRCMEGYTNYTIIFNGSSSDPTCKFYLNGKEKDIVESKANIVLEDHVTYPLKNYLETATNNIIGNDIKISSIAFLNRELSANEVHILNTLMKIRNA